ncbi:PREDICTED: olfactory receptor 14C36-like [Chrysochloris asiatica]|uniref:Olfactory receptor 14C36-like n=1 Tax=Chrysochloris asiatica TaxID=185453 RepID=A0A9B0UDF5_CHRAS|nr:PREDICTED: olfactory receptor 14C36-like [Chrysochloris asiatica]
MLSHILEPHVLDATCLESCSNFLADTGGEYLPLSPNSLTNYTKMCNSTIVTEFLLTGFSDVWEIRVLHTMLFLMMYVATLTGNLLIVTVITTDQNLHTPMYFFLRNLSVLDICYISVTVPKACVIFLLNNRVISKVGCAAQIFLVFLCGSAEFLLLTIMAHDRYVAICQPLHYHMVMNPRVCVQMTLASVVSGLVYAGVHTGNAFRLSFCRSNVIHQFFCDIPSLLKLSCSDTLTNEITILASAIMIGGGCFAFITKTYIHIFSTVLKLPTRGERGKAFSTCIPHILIVTVFLSSGVTVYLKPTSNSFPIQDMIMSVFYSIVPPFLNPIIYSLRNKQMKEAIRRIMRTVTQFK